MNLTKEKLERLYLKHSGAELSDKLGVHITLIYRLLKQHGIKLKGRKGRSGRKRKITVR